MPGYHAEITLGLAPFLKKGGQVLSPLGKPCHIGKKMSSESVVYYLNRPAENNTVDAAEWLFAALGQFTGAELRELLYVAQEPEFFELIRGLFALSDESRSALQQFLTATETRIPQAVIEADGRCVLSRGASEGSTKPPLKVVS
jgi:hypothetical protein